jgi:diaminopimelate decarboxylase
MIYKKNEFLIDNIKTSVLAKKYATPLYCYSFKKLKQNILNFKKNFKSINPLICFSVKSNPNKILLSEIGKLGLGADVVSIGELMKSLKSGIKPNKIVFSGVGKTSNEIEYAVKKRILLINAESKSEILEIERIAKKNNKKVDIGIRLNPNTDAKTLSKISTGKKENKFGVNEKDFLDLVNYLKNSQNLKLKCISVHIGSQILDINPYKKMLKVLEKIIKKSRYQFEFVDLGGGMGISYDNSKKRLNLKKYSVLIKKFLKKQKCQIIFEPGRSIIGNSGILISKVIYIKESSKKDFVILDVAMNDFMRPALYNAIHKIIPVKKSIRKSKKNYEFVGPICESTDKFALFKNFQKLKEKDLVIILDVGAYGMSLSSNYNLRPKATELLIKSSKIKIISKRQKLKDLI